MQHTEVRTFQSVLDDGSVKERREFRDNLLGIVGFDDYQSPYVDLYVEGATVPFDTVNVWKSGHGVRQSNTEVLDLVFNRFETYRHYEEEEA